MDMLSVAYVRKCSPSYITSLQNIFHPTKETYRLISCICISYTKIKACNLPRSTFIQYNGLWANIAVNQLHIVVQESQALRYLL